MTASDADLAPVLAAMSRDGMVQVDLPTLGADASAFAAAARSGITRALLLPLHAGPDIIGMQTAGYRRPNATFDERQEKVAVGLAQLATMALASARLHQELTRQEAAEREARALAEAASQAKDDFLATLSHELRTPLNVILGYLEILDDTALDGRERDTLMARIRQASRQLFYMITDTLEISRLHGGQGLPQVEELPLAELWRVLRTECEELPHEPGVELRWADVVPDVRFATDRRMLLVVMRNLIGNALKFTPEGSVLVGATLGPGALVLSVTDTGIGIPLEARDRIFQMFQQVDASDRRRFSGVGLGLYIVRRFCSQIGAEVDFESEVGRGSRFTVRVPRGSTDEPRSGVAVTRPLS